MEYKIKITYWSKNGSLDNSDGEFNEEILPLVFTDLKKAKENLNRIAEFNKMCDDLGSYYSKKNNEEIINANKDKDWFTARKVNILRDIDNPSSYFAYDKGRSTKIDTTKYIPDEILADVEYNLILKTEEGKDYRLSAFWQGYFERFQEAEIILIEEGMKITNNRY